MSGILLLLGTNLADREVNLENAKNRLKEKGLKHVRNSSIYESEPWGITDQPRFLNQIIEVETELDPHELLQVCLEIENAMGRVRKQKWGERLIDIDILFYNDRVIDEDNLKIPHPGIPHRRFTLVPLGEKWEDIVFPDFGKTIKTLITICKDQLDVKIWSD